MQRFPIPRGAVLALLLAGAALAPPASASIERIPVNDDDTVVRTFGGSADHLPVRPNLGWREAVAWARTMPAVQTAMRVMADRGYVSLAAHDSALVSIDPPATAVVFPYARPGLALPPFHYGQPLLMVVTTLGREGEPATTVSGGVAIVDCEHGTVFSADSLQAYAASDASFEVQTVASGEGGPYERRYDPNTAWFTNTDSRFNKFIRCWGMAALATCIRPLFNFMRTPTGYVILYTQPEDLAFYMSFCALGTAGLCLWGVW